MTEILTIIYGIVELTNYILAYIVLFGCKITQKWYCIVMAYAGMIGVHTINIAMGNNIPYGTISILYGLFVMLFLLNGEKIKGVLLFPSIYLLTSILNIGMSYVLAVFTSKIQYDFRNDIKLVILAEVFFILLAFGYILYGHIKGFKESIFDFTWIQKIMLTLFLLFIFIIISAMQFLGNGQLITTELEDFLGMAVSLACISFLVILVWLSKSTKKNTIYIQEKKMLSLYMEDQEKYIKLVLEKDENMRKFRHDISAHLIVLQKYIEIEQYDAALGYLRKLNENIMIGKVERYTGIISIDAVINDRKKYMEEKNIDFIWEGRLYEEITKRIDIYDLCTLFINIINNGIEACERLNQDKIIQMKVKMDNGKIYIKESNSFCNTIRFDNEGNPISTKKDKINHGIGSKNIKTVLNKYNGIVEYTINNEKFIIEIVI